MDYGLAYRYIANGEHHEYKPDPRRCHDGTIEFTSIDAHDGASMFYSIVIITFTYYTIDIIQWFENSVDL